MTRGLPEPSRPADHRHGMRYCNQAGTSWPKPPEVANAIASVVGLAPSQAAQTLAAAHETIAASLGLHERGRLWLSPGCTSALQIAIAQLSYAPGQAIVTSHLEHHALLRPVSAVASHPDVRHVVLPWSETEPASLDALREVLRGEDVRLVAMTAASNVTGQRLPIAEAVALAHAHGATFLLDAAQVAGIDRDLAQTGADLIAFAGHKGPLGPQGIGGLWIADDLELAPCAAVCELGAGPPRRGPGYCDFGSVNVAGAAGLAAGLTWLQAHDDPWAVAHGCAVQLRARLRERDDVRVVSALPSQPATPTVSFVPTRLRLQDAEAHFARHDVAVRSGRHCAPAALRAVGEPDGTVRASFGPFNEPADVERILAALDAASSGPVVDPRPP